MSFSFLLWSDIRAFVGQYDPWKLAFCVPDQVAFLSRCVVWRALISVWALGVSRLPHPRLAAPSCDQLFPLAAPVEGYDGVDISHEAQIVPGMVLVHGHQIIGEITAGKNLFFHNGVLVGTVKG